MKFAPLLLGAALAAVFSSAICRAADFEGYAEGRGYAYEKSGGEENPSRVGWGTLLVKGVERRGEAAVVGSLRIEGSTDRSTGYLFDPADRESERAALSVRELWIRAPLTPELDLQAGRFFLGWGKTDGYSPADAFLPRDLTDPFADEKLPLWGARLSGQWGDFRGEAVFAPFTTPWRLPEPGSRFWPLPFEKEFLADTEGEPPPDGFVAVRLLLSHDDWDLGAWGRSGVLPAPVVYFRPVPGKPLVEPRNIWVREHGAGIEASRLVQSWILRAEVGALSSEGGVVEDALIWATGAERSWDEYTILVTFADNAGPRGKKENVPYDRALLPALIAAVNGQHPWGEWKVSWIAGLRKGDGLLRAEVGYLLTDEWKMVAGADYPYGPESGALGAQREGRRASGALRYSW